MKFLPLAVLSLAVAATEGVEYPTEAPTLSDNPHSDYPFSTTPFFSTSTLLPDSIAGCSDFKDSHSYVVWKLNKTFGDENCLRSELENGNKRVDCSFKVEGWFQASALYIALPYVWTEEEKASILPDQVGLANYQPSELVITDTYLNGVSSFAISLDFVESCMEDAKSLLQVIESRRETKAEDAPVMSPSVASDYPHSEYPHSEYPFYEDSFSEYPFSDVPFTSQPTENLFDCPDTHREIVTKLYDIFGEENCPVDDQGFDNTMECSGEVPNWWRASVTYEFNGSKNPDDTSETLDEFDPGSLIIIDTYKYGSSFAQFVDLNDPLGVNGNCIDATEIKNQLNTINSRLNNPALAPKCENKSGDFQVNKKKTLTCDHISRLSFKMRTKKCTKKVIAENCPGLCDKQECECTDLPVPFQFRDQDWTCDLLSQQKPTSLERKCAKTKFSETCPTVCLGQNFGDACYATY